MGEYAEQYYRAEMKRTHDFDPGEGSLYSDERPGKKRPICPVCGAKKIGIADHMRDKHGARAAQGDKP